MTPVGIAGLLTRVEPDHGYAVGQVDVAGAKADRAGVEALLAGEWAAGSGWIARQSAMIARPRQADDPREGAVLEAELALPGRSLQIRHTGPHWTVTTLTEGRGDPCLSDEVVVVTVHDEVIEGSTTGRAARYRRFWSLRGDGAAEIFACRFVQFEGIE